MRLLIVLVVLAVTLGVVIWWLRGTALPDAASVEASYATPLPKPDHPLAVYHLGHSLVGRDMPAFLAQLAGDGHRYDSQLGWGASLRDHWEPDVPVNGFEHENAHERFRPARDAIGSGNYDAVVLTEMVELRDAIRYHDSARYLSNWANLAHRAKPETRIFLYESWHPLNDPEGWLERIDNDLPALWEGQILLPDLARHPERPVHVIPAGQVLARFTRLIDERDGVDGISGREDLFTRDADGELDQIHLGDLGAILVALTHYAVLYQQLPPSLPQQFLRADGTPATPLSDEAADLMQQAVWQVVSAYPKTGVAQ